MAQWVKDPVLSLLWQGSISGLAQWVKDLVLLLLWHRTLLGLRFDPWPVNFRMPQIGPKSIN